MAAREANRGRRRPDGTQGKRWIVDFVLTYPDGSKAQRVERAAPKNTRLSAEQYERELRAQMLQEWHDARSGVAKKEVPTFGAFAERFMREYAVDNKPSERQSKGYVLSKHLLPRYRKRRLDSFTFDDVQRLKLELTAEKLKPRTVNNVLAVLSKLLRYAYQDCRIIGPEHVPRFKMMRVGDQPFDWLDHGAYDALVDGVAGRPDLLVAVLLAGDTGLRAGELAALQWRDVDQDAMRLTVRQSFWQERLDVPKGGKARVVPMTERLALALTRYRHLCSPFVLVRDAAATGKGRWAKQAASHWTKEVRRDRGREIYQLAELDCPARPWHALRHTYCSHLAMAGAEPLAIKELAGHASLTTTLRYMHLAPKFLRDAVGLLDKRHANHVRIKTA